MQKGRFDFYQEHERLEQLRKESLLHYLKSPVLIIIVLAVVGFGINQSISNSAKIGNVGNVGGSITIYNDTGKQVPKGHTNVTRYNREREEQFLEYLRLLDVYQNNIKMMLVSLNDRLVTLSDETSCYANKVNNELTHTHITFWYNECGEGYTPLDGSRIKQTDVKDSLGKIMYPDYTSLFNDKKIIPCIYIGD